MENKKLLTLFMLFILTVSLLTSVSAYSLGRFAQSEPVTLTQVCSDCDSVFISSVYSPTGVLLLSESEMVSNDNEFFLVFNTTFEKGKYIVSGYGNIGSETEVFTYDFTIGRTDILGLDLNSTFGLVIFLFIFLLAGIMFFLRFLTFSAILLLANSIIMLFNGVNYLYTVIVLIVGFLLLFGGSKKR